MAKKKYDYNKVYIVDGRRINFIKPKPRESIDNSEWYMCANYEIKKEREKEINKKLELIPKYVAIAFVVSMALFLLFNLIDNLTNV
jgi:hypothetical protein